MRQPGLKLSICISTFNRAGFIGATLQSIINQATSECEIVVIDGASVDNTKEVVEGYARDFWHLRYVRRDTNHGVDRDFDHAVEQASGEYCWLFSDDDLLKPGAVSTVLEALRHDYSLVLVNGEHRDFDMLNIRVPNFFGIESDRVYASRDMDRLFNDIGTCLICICCVVIKRSIWLDRNRSRYYGSRFIHVGVILERPLPGDTLVLAKPYMCFRLGNAQTHTTESFQVWYIGWPSLVWSLALSDSTKRRFCAVEPWRRLKCLLALRATDQYSTTEYRRWVRPRLGSLKRPIPAMVALLPRGLAHFLYVLYSSILREPKSPDDAFWTMLPKSLKALQ